MVGRYLAPCIAALTIACSSKTSRSLEDDEPRRAELATRVDAFDVPIDGLSHEEVVLFARGDALFDLPLREPDGLGPLYTRTSCAACHEEGGRGPGFVQKMVLVEADGVTPSPDQARLPFGATVHPLVAGGGKTPVVAPTGGVRVKLSKRVGPAVVGRGYIEAVLDSEIERQAAEQATRTDGIHGRVNHVVYASQPNPDTRYHTHQKGDVLIGRFGLKARIATLDDFTADALQHDMGITSPLRPHEIANPDGLTDDAKPGVDVAVESVNSRAEYLRRTAIPPRYGLTAEGAALFTRVKCAVCHTPSLKTRTDYPIARIAGAAATVYTDLLLHDMGEDLAEGTSEAEGEARPRDWRTAPLVGLRHIRRYLHDGRAASVESAIVAHGGEAKASAQLFQALSPSDRRTLLDFVGAL